jgi:predicted nucleic acid-binding protein
LRKYLDTSLLVAALTAEPNSHHVQDWLGKQSSADLLVSDWVVTEFSSALSVKLRMKEISMDIRAAALETFARMTSDSLQVASVASRHFRDAAQLANQFTLGIRSGDALHLAIAADNGAAIYTLDRRLASAGAGLGVSANLL